MGKKNGSLRILSYNMFSSSDYFKSVEDDPREMYEMLISHNPDIIILEEYYPGRCDVLRDYLLKHYDYFEYHQSIEYSSNAVFSKYPLSGWGEMKLNPNDNTIDDYNLTRAAELDDMRNKIERRSVSTVTVRLPNDSLHLIACHLASNHFDQVRETFSDTVSFRQKLEKISKCFEAGILEREVEVGYIMRNVRDLYSRNEKVIVVGDMNDVAGSKTLRAFRCGDILVNGWWERGFGPGFTFHAHKVMHFRLDHVLHTKNLRLADIRVLDVDYSDHRPVIADFE